jgi:maltose alpha-D-glucosyltransferase/alpha-amylase
VEAFAIDEFVLGLFDFIRNGRSLPSLSAGTFTGVATEKLGALAVSERPAVRRMDVEQSNTSIVVDERIMFKGYRRLHAGPQPELEIARFLDAAGYRNTPELYGFLEHTDAAGAVTALCILQQFVESQGDGWTVTLSYLERFFDRRKNLAAHDDAAQHDYHQIFLERARTMGVRTAELHRAFATPTADPAFAAEPVSDLDLEAWSEQARTSARRALDALEREIDKVPSELREFGQSLLARRDEFETRLTLPRGGHFGNLMKTRYHGDFHLGQVLVVADDFRIVDFEGEPARPLEQRRIKGSPLRDVAGMLRSINYAAVAALRGSTHDRAEDTSRLAPFAIDWERRSSAAFLSGYRETIEGCPSYPADPAQADQLLEFFILEKAFYEMSYELANRPAWVRIPLEGIRSILNAGATAVGVAGD